jgi:tetratricopeptide (TPR) repeat protein
VDGAIAAQHPEDALALAERGVQLHPRSPALALALARARASMHRTEGAERAISLASRLGATPEQVALARARLYASTGNVARMRQALRVLKDEAGSEPDRLAAAEATAARLEMQTGDFAEAIRALERAHSLDGQVSHLSGIFEIAKSQGWLARAEVARRRMCGLDPSLEACTDR